MSNELQLPKPTGDEALAILEAAKEAGHLPEGFIEERLAAMRKETGEKATAVVAVESKKELAPEEQQVLLSVLKGRFERNKKLHPKIQWTAVEKSLQACPDSMWSLQQLEATGGEPDVFMEENDAFVFGDCSA